MAQLENSKIPANSAAETILKLDIQNKDIDTQILELVKTQANNNKTILDLEKIAEWEEEPVEDLVSTAVETPPVSPTSEVA